MASADDSDNVILDANSSRILKKLLACYSCKAYHGGLLYFCGKGHNVCSLCHTKEGDECPVDECSAKLMSESCVSKDFTHMVSAMKLPVPCNNRENGCMDQHIIEKMEEHESECEYRKIIWGKKVFLVKDFAAMVDNDYIKEQKWHFYAEEEENKYRGVFKFFIGPDQHRFCVEVGILTDEDAPLRVSVIGGTEVAKKYKAELRIFSNEKNISVTYNGPVFPVDDPDIADDEAFEMKPVWFATFNHGCQYFGDHNKDKNGEIVIPVLYKIIKKELDIPTDLVEDGEMHEDKK